MEIQSARSYSTAAACHDDLPLVLRRMNQGRDRHVVGRCEALDDLGIDPIVTGAGVGADNQSTIVRVTRFVGGKPLTQEVLVPAGD